MSSKSPEESPTAVRGDAIELAIRELALHDSMRRERLKINTALLATMFGIFAFFGRDLYSDVKGHTTQLAALTERVAGIKEKVDKIAVDTEQNGRSLAEIKGFLQAPPAASSKGNSAATRASRH